MQSLRTVRRNNKREREDESYKERPIKKRIKSQRALEKPSLIPDTNEDVPETSDSVAAQYSRKEEVLTAQPNKTKSQAD